MFRKPPTTVVPPPPQLILGLPPWVAAFGILSGLHAIGFLVVKAYGAKPPHKDANLPAHFLPQLVGFIALAYQGLSLWFTMPSDISDLEAYYAPGEMVSATMMGFQLYELLACIPTPRLRGPGLGFEMIMHHLIAGGLGCLRYLARPQTLIANARHDTRGIVAHTCTRLPPAAATFTASTTITLSSSWA